MHTCTKGWMKQKEKVLGCCCIWDHKIHWNFFLLFCLFHFNKALKLLRKCLPKKKTATRKNKKTRKTFYVLLFSPNFKKLKSAAHNQFLTCQNQPRDFESKFLAYLRKRIFFFFGFPYLLFLNISIEQQEKKKLM